MLQGKASNVMHNSNIYNRVFSQSLSLSQIHLFVCLFLFSCFPLFILYVLFLLDDNLSIYLSLFYYDAHAKQTFFFSLVTQFFTWVFFDNKRERVESRLASVVCVSFSLSRSFVNLCANAIYCLFVAVNITDSIQAICE